MENDYRQPRSYELMTVLLPDLDDEATTAEVEKVQAVLMTAGQLVHTQQTSPWGRRRLAYTIRHNGQDYRDGYYLLTNFTALPDRTAEIERELKLDPRVMRYLLVQSEPFVAPVGEESEGTPEAEAAGAAATAATTTATAVTGPESQAAPANGAVAAPEEAAEEAETGNADTAESASEPAGDGATDAAAAATSTAGEDAAATREV